MATLIVYGSCKDVESYDLLKSQNYNKKNPKFFCLFVYDKKASEGARARS